ncbi:hypothetical protein SASPL_135996 [Salvia splendens]|uniref:Protein kinase domain-containing protein n=1 Tax=Salvia splendens TaxID=180675 RepID=A0A8X8X0J7_SALSN|nr:hypothetical protein SASPL_135996 [Salvia splendens]
MRWCFYLFGGEEEEEPNTRNPNSARTSVEPRKSGLQSRGLNRPPNLQKRPSNLKVFTLLELKQITRNFSNSAKLGEGGFGCVFKGVIKSSEDPDKKIAVAIKQLGKQGQQVHSLSTDSLPWAKRLRVALDAARGLAYLHEEMDFQVVGTMGYAAPEYVRTGHLTSMSDVWSYGVFLYELITGRRPLERNRPKKEQKLLEWIKPHLSDARKFEQILDPRLKAEGNHILKSAMKLSIVANRCLVRAAKTRPKMSELAVMVNEVVDACSDSGLGRVAPPFKRNEPTRRDSTGTATRPTGPTRPTRPRTRKLVNT